VVVVDQLAQEPEQITLNPEPAQVA
jgi:hypothetical protein